MNWYWKWHIGRFELVVTWLDSVVLYQNKGKRSTTACARFPSLTSQVILEGCYFVTDGRLSTPQVIQHRGGKTLRRLSLPEQ
ncbi:hypothetical protein M758_6G065700 [Ceratodon purpureus]|uniref:Uncharacterized protein n=1 Tax=Ceratodon purpureus TaxID=3225 RepID=A0A8T0HBL5_CERPU|nr:hypothetical protein KC19_6G069800 [Ceratodon purpureus]KAG0612958.1 hypothetical protein M758_6G065700 [Ceratodon purpureus]